MSNPVQVVSATFTDADGEVRFSTSPTINNTLIVCVVANLPYGNGAGGTTAGIYCIDGGNNTYNLVASNLVAASGGAHDFIGVWYANVKTTLPYGFTVSSGIAGTVNINNPPFFSVVVYELSNVAAVSLIDGQQLITAEGSSNLYPSDTFDATYPEDFFVALMTIDSTGGLTWDIPSGWTSSWSNQSSSGGEGSQTGSITLDWSDGSITTIDLTWSGGPTDYDFSGTIATSTSGYASDFGSVGDSIGGQFIPNKSKMNFTDNANLNAISTESDTITMGSGSWTMTGTGEYDDYSFTVNGSGNTTTPSSAAVAVQGDIDYLSLSGTQDLSYSSFYSSITTNNANQQALWVLFKAGPAVNTSFASTNNIALTHQPKFQGKGITKFNLAPLLPICYQPTFRQKTYWTNNQIAIPVCHKPSFTSSGTQKFSPSTSVLIPVCHQPKFTSNYPTIRITRGGLSLMASHQLEEGQLYAARYVYDGNAYTSIFVGGYDGKNKLVGAGTQVISGEPSFTPSEDGLWFVDDENGKLWVYYGGAWHYATLT